MAFMKRMLKRDFNPRMKVKEFKTGDKTLYAIYNEWGDKVAICPDRHYASMFSYSAEVMSRIDFIMETACETFSRLRLQIEDRAHGVETNETSETETA